MQLAETVTFGGSGLDRAAHLRGDGAEIARLLAAAGVLALWRGRPLVTADGAGLCWLPAHHPLWGDGAGPDMFLGLDDATPRFARVIGDWPGCPGSDGAAPFDADPIAHPDVAGASFVELRGVMAALSPRAAELAATARALMAWHQSHRFCATCGAPSAPAMAGWQRDCAACGAHHFPRTDPVVIMLVTQGNRLLLGRNAAWPPGMYSLLAGFVEPGETLEAAVRREVWEEAGVRVGQVEYLASQPWPFPASLMLGCRAEAISERITIDPTEIEDAQWVTREQVMAIAAGAHPTIRPFRPGAIAGFLIENWLADRLD